MSNKTYEPAFIEGIMSEKVFIYTVLAYDKREVRADGNGYLYDRDTVVRVTARDEQMALAQAKQAVQDRACYVVIEVNERMS